MGKIIEGEEFSGFVDHDYEKLKELSLEGRIIWFGYRYKKIIFGPIEAVKKIINEEMVIEESKRRLENNDISIMTSLVLIICVGVDLLGGFLSGKRGDTCFDDFRAFVKRYLDQKNEYLANPYSNIKEYSELLYSKFRCGLAHNLAIKKVGFTFGRDEYFVPDEEFYYISVDRLFEDLKQGFNDYLSDVKINKEELKDKFKDRFEHVFLERK